MPFAVTFSLQYLGVAIKRATQYTWIYDASLHPLLLLPTARCMHPARMLFIEEKILNFTFQHSFHTFLEEKFHRKRKFPLFILFVVHSSLDIHKLFSGKQIFSLWFGVLCTRRRNNGVRDQLLNSMS